MIHTRNITALILLCILSTFCSLGATGKNFVHPGLLHSREAIERTRGWVQHRNEVAMGSYEKLLRDAKAQSSYRIAGPFEVIARDGEHRRTKSASENDFLAAYYNALLFVITGDVQHAETSLNIIRSYARTLQHIDGHDAPLCAGLQGFILVNACELLRYCYSGWSAGDSKSTEAMFRRAFLPVLDDFDRRSPYANGNWGAAVNKMRIAVAVYTNDAKQYSRALDYYRYGNDNGSLANYISATGQCQESGRDQAHVMLGLGQLAEVCEVAWNQGDDLYGELDNRLLTAYEYTSRANLGMEVPFEKWTDKTGKYCNWQVLAEGAMGQWRSVFELPYNHYVGRRHLPMPATSLVLGHYVRPEGAGFTCDNPGFGSLLFYQGTEVDAFTAVPTPLTYKMNSRRSYDVLAEPVVRIADAPRLSLVRTVDCWPEYWDLLPVRQKENMYEYEPRGALSRNGYVFAEGEVSTTFLVRETSGLPPFVDGGASTAAPPPFSISPLPEKDGPVLSADYDVEIRRAESSDDVWTPVPVLRCHVDTRRPQQAAFAEFDMSEPVVVRITNHRPEQAADVDVRPHSRGLSVDRQNDSIVLLRLDRPEYLSLEFGGDRLHNLHLLVNAPLTEHHTPSEPKSIDWVAPNSQDVFVEGARLIYFGPGVHKPKDLPSEEIQIPSNCTVYLAPGAVVQARLIVDRAANVRIVG
ncbi:MAG: alginate lyase family protein, partial [Bacteroidaceae bacterium]|nr:alginate lyase family protein [Bacteroidaceae bacterium]